MAAGLCASFIVADGATKSVGAWLLHHGVSEAWMPAAAGLLFALPLGLFAAMLARVPRPTADDVAARSERRPMSAAARRAFFGRHALGLSAVIAAYLLVTVLRSVRADFMPELWRGLGVAPDAAAFTQTETLVAAGVILVNGATVLVADNRRALFAGLTVAAAGPLLVVAALLLRPAASAGAFVVLVGLGLYLPYIAVHTTVFERLVAVTRGRGTVGYLMTLADAVGYLGYVGVLLVKEVAAPAGDFLPFFLGLAWAVAGAAVVLLVVAAAAFRRTAVAEEG